MNVETLTPYPSPERKREQITRLFDRLARRYDRLNRILSLGLDTGWRRRALKHLGPPAPLRLLDVATGTADFAIQAARALPEARVSGVDLSEAMLAIGREKVARAGLDHRVTLQTGDALALAFDAASFDAVTVAFGLRNFENLAAGLREMRRVLKPRGMLLVLELSQPTAFPLRGLHRLLLHRWVPLAGRLLTRLGPEYAYLPASIEQVPQGESMLGLLQAAGFTECRAEPYTFGACTCYTGIA